MLKDFTRPIQNFKIAYLPKEIVVAHEKLIAARKLFSILKSKSVKKLPLNIGDKIETFIKNNKEKRGTRTEPRHVLN